MQTSVVEALKAAGLYKDTGRIQEQMAVTITASGEEKEHKLAEIDYFDIKTFANELDIALNLQNTYVQSLYAKNATKMVDLIRAVNVESASGFKGAVGSGRQLDAIMLRAEQFQDADIFPIVPTYRTSWIRNITVAMAAAGPTNFIESDVAGVAAGTELAMADEEGLALLGFANPAPQLCVDAIQITYIAQAYNIQNLDFELANPFVGDAICELKQPLLVFPKETALVRVKYYRTGSDELRPIGLWVKMSSALRALLTS
ncbi:MAG TPA: hypothetical protein VMV84_03700 [Dehalococcoidales bacterium]|nr:hypothetical protein [Dehalococcoidales bacterium]